MKWFKPPQRHVFVHYNYRIRHDIEQLIAIYLLVVLAIAAFTFLFNTDLNYRIERMHYENTGQLLPRN